MRCPICFYKKTNVLEQETEPGGTITKTVECDNCLTEFQTKKFKVGKEELVEDSVPAYVLNKVYKATNGVTFTKEEIEEAEKKNIFFETIRRRILKGMDKERALTMPVRKVYQYEEYLKKAHEYNIKKVTFYNRISLGWTPEEAATKPLQRGCKYENR